MIDRLQGRYRVSDAPPRPVPPQSRRTSHFVSADVDLGVQYTGPTVVHEDESDDPSLAYPVYRRPSLASPVDRRPRFDFSGTGDDTGVPDEELRVPDTEDPDMETTAVVDRAMGILRRNTTVDGEVPTEEQLTEVMMRAGILPRPRMVCDLCGMSFSVRSPGCTGLHDPNAKGGVRLR